MEESHLSCHGFKAVPSGRWSVTYTTPDGRQCTDPYEWASDETANARADEYMAAGATSAGWQPLYFDRDGSIGKFRDLGPGAFHCVTDEAMGGPAVMIVLPEGSDIFLPVKLGDPGGERVWGWDGNTEAPTIRPSIWYKGRWHGFLEAGFFRSV